MTDPACTMYFEAGPSSRSLLTVRLIDRPVEEGELAILHVLERVGIDRRLFARNIECSGLRVGVADARR